MVNQFYTHPIDHLCMAAAHLTSMNLEVRRLSLDAVFNMAAHLTLSKLGEDNRPAVKAMRAWLREPIQPHSAEYDAAWHEAIQSA